MDKYTLYRHPLGSSERIYHPDETPMSYGEALARQGRETEHDWLIINTAEKSLRTKRAVPTRMVVFFISHDRVKWVGLDEVLLPKEAVQRLTNLPSFDEAGMMPYRRYRALYAESAAA